MRSNLQSLQKTQSLMDMTQERLSTGNKVNSAIDNPSSYYTAQSLNNRASDLSSLLDSMGQAIQTIKSADQAITSITKFAEQAKAVASSALDSGSLDEIKSYQDQFNSIRNQITQLAGDASYKGVNLLAGDSLTVTFNEGRTSSITVDGQKADATSLGLNEATDWNKASGATTTAKTALDTAKGAAIGNGADEYATQELKDAAVATAQKTYDDAVKADIKTNKTAINASVKEVETAISTLRSMASTFGNNYSIVQNRQDFTENLVSVLTEGADKLTLADMNEESANMLALQTRQQLAINSLSLASQASQSVLKLF